MKHSDNDEPPRGWEHVCGLSGYGQRGYDVCMVCQFDMYIARGLSRKEAIRLVQADERQCLKLIT